MLTSGRAEPASVAEGEDLGAGPATTAQAASEMVPTATDRNREAPDRRDRERAVRREVEDMGRRYPRQVNEKSSLIERFAETGALRSARSQVLVIT
jgi:hypothetical protein